MQKADHSGHRARMKEKYLKNGLDAFAPHEILEMLLFYAIPYRNTNEIAKSLIDRFGSLSGVFDATPDALREAGLTENQIIYLNLIPDVTRAYYVEKYESPHKIIDIDHLPQLLAQKFIAHEHEEVVWLLLVDQKFKELYSGIIARGNFETADFSIKDIVRLAVTRNATAAIIAHNHPSGWAMPSQADLDTTERIREALALIGVRLLNHYIIADHECVALYDLGMNK